MIKSLWNARLRKQTKKKLQKTIGRDLASQNDNKLSPSTLHDMYTHLMALQII